jgi:hypothetical protein
MLCFAPSAWACTAVLPHFMADAHPELCPILSAEARPSRSMTHADSKDLARIRAVAEFIYSVTEVTPRHLTQDFIRLETANVQCCD